MKKKNGSDQSKRYGRLRPSEMVLGIIAVLMLLGWFLRWMNDTGPPESVPSTGFPWFATFSVPSAVLVLVLVFLKLNCIEFLPEKVQERILPFISLLPVLGFLIEELSSVQTFLTVGGAVALAYISATSYWRNYIPEFITNPLGTDDDEGRKPSPPGTAAATAKEEKKEKETETETETKDVATSGSASSEKKPSDTATPAPEVKKGPDGGEKSGGGDAG